MNISTIVGLVLGLVSLVVGMMLKGAPLVNLVNNPAAYVIIFVGTAGTVFMAFPMSEVKKIPKLFKLIFSEPKLIDRTQLISTFMEWAGITRREGLLALEPKVEEIDDAFLRSGMRMIIDGNDQEFVSDVLMEDINATEERHRAGALIFSQAGMYAPTLGVLGAVIGLIAALADLSDMEKLSHAIAAAFIATLLGIFSGYVLWHPMANKLKRMSKKEVEIKLMMVEGLLSIQSGVSTIAISQKLSVFLTPTEREKLSSKEAESGEQKD
ncbi:flagellar motor stator protein MotA [Paenibacillus sp. JX-17]|uniref:Flagellar motor stator protein MotA n=1 Tax=Paenibacillus lacisoli TaxID=3064525 RepID=A0ABT9CHD4_9BACL|nr:flagellar motor stator protein MotA [Paenibacillus sp. JX-17]MDO7908687.1 flagellar motor stator protein MotA [Paenibacillus sp. JX-17]